MSSSSTEQRAASRIDLALQGGGAHGAFTWGVLDALLEDERLEIAAVSGTSAGAMNAVVLADGLMQGGRREARAALQRFWTRVSRLAASGSALQNPLAHFLSSWSLAQSPVQAYLDWFGDKLSPYQTNPFDINPLRDIVAAEVDFERVRACDKIDVIVAATNVRTGRLKEFRGNELSLDSVMASACLPTLFQAVEIDGESYWDGGYLGNPSLLPLIAQSATHDLVLVQINPSQREAVPRTASAIADRLNEITFNSSLVKELRSIALIKDGLAAREKAAAAGKADGMPTIVTGAALLEQIARLRMHRIEAGGRLLEFGARSKVNTALPFLSRLRRIGHATAKRWLTNELPHVGRRATFDLQPYL